MRVIVQMMFVIVMIIQTLSIPALAENKLLQNDVSYSNNHQHHTKAATAQYAMDANDCLKCDANCAKHQIECCSSCSVDCMSMCSGNLLLISDPNTLFPIVVSKPYPINPWGIQTALLELTTPPPKYR